MVWIGGVLVLAALACNLPNATATPEPLAVTATALAIKYAEGATLPAVTQTPQPTQGGIEGLPESFPSIEAPTLPATANDPRVGAEEKNVLYCRMGDQFLYLDVYYPYQDPPDKGWPAVMMIHGGLWMSGDKSNDPVLKFKEALRWGGYFVVSVNYRLSPEFVFPAHFDDVRCAVRYLRANAELYSLNSERIAALGHSSGGHLAALLGTVDAQDGWAEFGDHLGRSSRVSAVVDLAGVSDPGLYCTDSVVQQVFAAQNCQDHAVVAAANPATYITPDDPPFLLIHGDRDQGVALEFSTYLERKLLEGGVSAILIRVENAGHSFTEGSLPFVPTMDELGQLIVIFLNAYMP